jgi:hypothetical protein
MGETMAETKPQARRIAVIGGGPIGLEVAIAARTLGWPVTLYERGEIAANVGEWGHARLFSPFAMNRSALGAALVAESGGALPSDTAYITGHEHREAYLAPIARHPILRDVIRTGCTVLGVARAGHIKKDISPSREAAPFRLLVCDARGVETIEEADVVVDASGTYRQPNALGAGGLPCPGETAANDRITRGLDDICGQSRARYAGKRVLLVGAGHSAASSAIALEALAKEEPETRVLWAARTTNMPPYAVDPTDQLEERRAVCEAANRIAAGGSPAIRYRGGLEVVAIAPTADGALRVRLAGPGGDIEETADVIVSNVGYGPDASLYRELQVHECYATLGPMNLSAAVQGSSSSDCLMQKSHGPETLINPEPNFFILGAKSYGRNPNFLIRVGIEQVRDLFRILTGRPDLDVTAAPRPGAARSGR